MRGDKRHRTPGLRNPGSERVDPVSGITERVRFVGAEGEKIFTVLSLPQGRIKGGVVLAPSLLTDRVRSYRAEVKAARQLANLGLAVLRFDYRGFGHSDGETGVTDARRLHEDLQTASAELQDLLKEEDVAMVGSRFGSLLVANRNVPTRRAVLWDPVLSGAEYFRTAFRARDGGPNTSTRLFYSSEYAARKRWPSECPRLQREPPSGRERYRPSTYSKQLP